MGGFASDNRSIENIKEEVEEEQDDEIEEIRGSQKAKDPNEGRQASQGNEEFKLIEKENKRESHHEPSGH